MLAKSRGSILFGACFVLCTSAAWAQFTAIEGVVKDPDGKPVQGAQILIEREDMKGTYKGAKTDKKGHYIYNGLPIGGKYTVSVIVDGQKKDSASGVQTEMGDPTPVNFDLKNVAEQQQAVQKAAEAGTLTKEQENGLSKEQKEALEKRAKENAAAIAKNKALNDAFNAGKEAIASKNYDAAIEAFEKGDGDGSESARDLGAISPMPTSASPAPRPAPSRPGCLEQVAGSVPEGDHPEARRSCLSQQLRAGAGQGQEDRRCPGVS